MKVSTITVRSTANAITIQEAKAQLRIAEDDHTYDSEILSMITDATQWLERRYGISILTQTRVQRQDNFYDCWPPVSQRVWYPVTPIKLLYPPVQTVTGFTYQDFQGNVQNYALNTDYKAAGLVTPVLGGSEDLIIPRLYAVNSWPANKNVPEAVQITYKSGYGDDASYVPGPVRRGIKMLLTHFNENRQEEMVGERVAKFEMGLDRVMAGYEVHQHSTIEA